MAPPGSIKNSGSVHLSCIAVLSNPCRHGNGANNLALDLHLLLAGPPGSPDERAHQEKTILTHYFNAKGFSFEEPRVCCDNVLVCLPTSLPPNPPDTQWFQLTSVGKNYRLAVGEEIINNKTHDGLGDIASVCSSYTMLIGVGF